MTELLSCPFCGGKAHDVGPYGEGLFAVRCDQCGGGVSGFDQCRQDAIDAWNTRAAPVPQCDAETGYAIVPIEPTVEQHIAAMEFALEHMKAHGVTGLSPFEDYPPLRETTAGMYRAMVNAAALVSTPSEAGREMVHRTSDAPEQRSGHPAAENAAARFVMWALMEGSWQGLDIDGGAAQDKAVALGLITETTYDPAIHGDGYSCDAGDRWYVPSTKLLAALEASAVENNRTGATSAEEVIVPIKSSDQGTVAVASAQCNSTPWDAHHNRSYEPVETRAKEIYDFFEYREAGEKPAWVPVGNSLMQDEARICARRQLREAGHTPVVTSTHHSTPEKSNG